MCEIGSISNALGPRGQDKIKLGDVVIIFQIFLHENVYLTDTDSLPVFYNH